MATELGSWTLQVFSKSDNLFFINRGWPKATFLCYLSCASELARSTGNAEWFLRSISEMADDMGMSKRMIERYFAEFYKAGLIDKRKRFLGLGTKLMIRSTDESPDRKELVIKEVGKLKARDAKKFIAMLVPIDSITQDIRNCFLECPS